MLCLYVKNMFLEKIVTGLGGGKSADMQRLSRPSHTAFLLLTVLGIRRPLQPFA